MPHWFYTYFVHVLSGDGYQFWSGIGSDIGELTLLTAFAIFIRQRNCHVHRCWRLAWHPHPVHGHPVCRKHHPHSTLIHPETGQITTGATAQLESSTSAVE